MVVNASKEQFYSFPKKSGFFVYTLYPSAEVAYMSVLFSRVVYSNFKGYLLYMIVLQVSMARVDFKDGENLQLS